MLRCACSSERAERLSRRPQPGLAPPAFRATRTKVLCEAGAQSTLCLGLHTTSPCTCKKCSRT